MVIVIEWVLKLAPIGVFALAFVVGRKVGIGCAWRSRTLYRDRFDGRHRGMARSPIWLPYVRRKGPLHRICAANRTGAGVCGVDAIVAREPAADAEKGRGTWACANPLPDLVLPMAVALLRVTGPAMNLAVALYVANWFGIELDAFDYSFAIFIAALTSMGAVSLPGTVSFVTSIAPICLALGIPVEPLGTAHRSRDASRYFPHYRQCPDGCRTRHRHRSTRKGESRCNTAIWVTA